MKKSNLIIITVFSLLFVDGCSTIKKLLPSRKSNDDISYELIENLSTAFSEGKLQALEEMIAIYNDSNQPYDVRLAAGWLGWLAWLAWLAGSGWLNGGIRAFHLRRACEQRNSLRSNRFCAYREIMRNHQYPSNFIEKL